jgi:hypothetical protein
MGDIHASRFLTPLTSDRRWEEWLSGVPTVASASSSDVLPANALPNNSGIKMSGVKPNALLDSIAYDQGLQ